MKKRYDLDGWTLGWLGLVAAFFAAFLFYPVSFMLRRAFGTGGEFTLEYFGLWLASPLQREALWNSTAIALLTTGFTTLLALPLAHGMTRYRFRGQALLGGLLLVPLIMPPFVGAIGLRQLLARFGSVNLLLMDLGWLPRDQPIDWLGAGGFWGIVLLQTLSLYPIMFLNLSAALANVDPALREAAQNLGASGSRVFRTVTLPLILPGWFAGAIIVFIWAFTDLGTPLIFGYARVVPVQIFDSITELNTNPMGYALVVVVLVLTLVLFLISKRLLAGRRYEMLARGHTASGGGGRDPAADRVDLAGGRRRAGSGAVAAPGGGNAFAGGALVPDGVAGRVDRGQLWRAVGAGADRAEHSQQPVLRKPERVAGLGAGGGDCLVADATANPAGGSAGCAGDAAAGAARPGPGLWVRGGV
ncbi:MAG: ABC transporter permease subunit [Verrucomicrobia bacterium]|nr:ABC transporter permease subunit [Verrucomicrobiota bacterium]